jgi:ribonuclease Z
MKFKVLGAGSATPVVGRYPSAFALNHENETFLIDCGEGTQWRMLEFGVKHHKINHIFISHLHGDHFLGLVGLISSMNSLGRKQKLTVYAPPGLKEIITIQFKYQETRLEFDLVLIEIISEEKSPLFESATIVVSSFPLVHRISTFGFLFEEKIKPRNFKKDKLSEEISLANIHQLKQGKDVLDENGKIKYTSEEYTFSTDLPKTFAYCSDTAYSESILPFIQNADLLYHESTFLQDKIRRAEETFHSTATQAASIAFKSNVKHLVLGHFSARYKEIEPFFAEASGIFPNLTLAIGGTEIDL